MHSDTQLLPEGRLQTMLTDVWCSPDQPFWGKLSRRAAERFHPELADARVRSWNTSAAGLRLRTRLRRQTGWSAIKARNEWYQDLVVEELQAIQREYPSRLFAVFAYSYDALKIFQFVKKAGWVSILGQIDPGPAEERIVADLHRQSTLGQASSWVPPPRSYWESWRKECELADRIIVNSVWSSDSLANEGIPRWKICTVPLVIQPASETLDFKRVYPARFTADRPLRLLFLGQAGLRKGIELVIEAADRLVGQPVEIWIVGPVQILRIDSHGRHPVLRWFGNVPRSSVNQYYRDADAFLFPTFSDGFGITQLEAQSWKLPLIVSRFCGDVVSQGVNGLILDPLSSRVLVETVQDLLQHPGHLDRMACQSALKPEHTMTGLATRLTSVLVENRPHI